MRKAIFALVIALLTFGPIGAVQAQPPDDRGNQNRPCENWPADHPVFPEHPLCVDGVFVPPGCERAPEGKNPNCPPADNGNGNGNGENGNGVEECPAVSGPISGIVIAIAGEWEAGGGPEAVSDLLIAVACLVFDLTTL